MKNLLLLNGVKKGRITVALVQVQLVNAENAGRLEAVPAPQEFGAGVENVAYRLLVQARNIIKSKLLKIH